MIIRRLLEIATQALTRDLAALCLVAITLFAAVDPILAAKPWPEGLREAVHSYFQTLQVSDYRTRDSTLEEPLGIQPMTEFDRAGHKCHEVPGQVYRIYKMPGYFSEDTDGSFLVRSRFDLFFRQAGSIVEIFSQPWEKGSNGAIQVRFKKVDGNWEAVEKRELLE